MKIKVSIIVAGKFHAFYLAEQLEKRNLLDKIITSYPKFLVSKYSISKNRIISVPTKEIIERICIKLKVSKILKYLQYYLNFFFEIRASKKLNLDNINILVGWSGNTEKSFLKVLKNNNKVIKLLERGSSHILFQDKILTEEYKIFSSNRKAIDQKIIDKELREYNLADYIIVPSEFARNTFLQNNFKDEKIIKIPYGVDLSQFTKTKIKPKEFTIISVGSVSFRKGSYYLMKAFDQLKLPNSKLIFIGYIDPEIKDVIKPFARRGNIKFTGHIPQHKLKNFYNKAHLSIICSIEEGMAMVQAQAMASGVPLICTTNSGGAEIVDDNLNGFVCPIRNVEKLKEKILLLYRDRDMLNLFSENAYSKAQQYFSWDSYGDRVHNAYEQIIKKHTKYD